MTAENCQPKQPRAQRGHVRHHLPPKPDCVSEQRKLPVHADFGLIGCTVSRNGHQSDRRGARDDQGLKRSSTLTWQQEELLAAQTCTASAAQQHSAEDRTGRVLSQPRHEIGARLGLTWQQRQLLETQTATTLLKPIFIPSLDRIELLKVDRDPQPPPLRFSMTQEGPQVLLHSPVPEPFHAKCSIQMDTVRPKAPTDSASDLPSWYDPAKDGPLRVEAGGQGRCNAGIGSSDASHSLSRQNLKRFDGSRRSSASSSLSSSTSAPELDASSLCSNSPSLSSINSSSPTLQVSLPAFGGSPAAPSEFQDAAGKRGRPDPPCVYAGPNFCNSPLPQKLPVPTFGRRRG